MCAVCVAATTIRPVIMRVIIFYCISSSSSLSWAERTAQRRITTILFITTCKKGPNITFSLFQFQSHFKEKKNMWILHYYKIIILENERRGSKARRCNGEDICIFYNVKHYTAQIRRRSSCHVPWWTTMTSRRQRRPNPLKLWHTQTQLSPVLSLFSLTAHGKCVPS